MNELLSIQHDHVPIFRVVRVSWENPLDASFSIKRSDNRWNTTAFPALYCCCSVNVAVAVARDRFRLAGVTWSDLQPDMRPQLVELSWVGTVVDIVSADGVVANGFLPDYPSRTDKAETQAKAVQWHSCGLDGVVSRSASLANMGFSNWTGIHEPWGELAIFISNTKTPPTLVTRRTDLDTILGDSVDV